MQSFISTPRARKFLCVWFGQFLSVIGSGMTSFVLAIWTYRLNSSTAQFATVVFAAAFPSIVMAPFAGTLVDRWDSRKVLAWSVVGQSVATGALACMFAFGHVIAYWDIYPAVVAIAVCGSCQGPALTTVGATLLEKSLYSRASGLWQLNQAAVMLVSPMIAAAIVGVVHIGGVIAFDAVSYIFALGSLLCLREPIRAVRASVSANERSAGAVRRFLRDIVGGWLFIRRFPSLTHLLLFSLFLNLIYGIVQILTLPLTIKNGTPGDLAWVMALSAIGMLVGSIVMATWKGPPNQVGGMVVSSLGVGLALLVAGLQRAMVPLVVCFFFFALFIPLGQAMRGSLWMRKTEPVLLGRVTATTGMLIQMCFPLACVIAPILADHMFQPLLAHDSRSWLAGVFGTGAQRGIGLLLSVLGLLTVACSALVWLDRPIRDIELLMPDAVRAAVVTEASDIDIDIDQASDSSVRVAVVPES